MNRKNWRRYFIIAVLLLFFWMGAATVGMAAPKKSQKPATVPKETITYVVKKGDTVDKIAKNFEVSSDDIARWNNLSDIAHIQIGQKLRVRVPKSSPAAKAAKSETTKQADSKKGKTNNPEPKVSVTYTVKKGDNLAKISRKTGVSIEDLKKYNKALKKNPDQIRIGQTLILSEHAVSVNGSGAKSVSHGLANNGYLTGGVQMPKGKGYYIRNPKRSYGTATTVALIQNAMAAYVKKYPSGPQFGIGDLSVQKGGKLTPHLSHQSGRDVDITMIRNKTGALDIEKNWFLIEHFLKTKKVQYIFLDYNLQKPFYDYARKHGYSEAQLRTLIQYPNGKQSYMAILRHSKGHYNHIHVRFVCAPTDSDCH